MNERERIELLMKCYELSPSQFAEKTGIQRASVSHILSGRNKPSLEVLLKIYDAFPELDLKWLMTGAGEEPVTASKSAVSAVPSVENSLFSQPEHEQPELQQVLNVVQSRQEQAPQRPVRQQQQQRVVVERQPRRTAVTKTQQQPVNEKRIKEIRIFYTDGTYETLFPEK